MAFMAGVDNVGQASLPVESYISPACIEGDARYVPFMDLVVEQASLPAMQSSGPRWYANLPLAEDDLTTATATFQNGALEVPFSVDWVPYNLIDHDGETLTIRKGDSVKFVALPADAVGGQFELEYLLDIEGDTVRSPNTDPLVRTFLDAGTYTVSGQYTHGNDVVSASITVEVLDGAFPEENPACLVGQWRDWTCDNLPAEAVLEADSSVIFWETTSGSTSQRSFSLTAYNPNGEHVLIARAYPGGPIIDSIRLDTFWIQNAVDGYVWVVKRLDDSELWELDSIEKYLPDTVDIRIKVFVGGVMLDDYSLERWITNADYDETGTYYFRLFHPNDSYTSVCHTFEAYQNGQLIGTDYAFGEKDFSEEE